MKSMKNRIAGLRKRTAGFCLLVAVSVVGLEGGLVPTFSPLIDLLLNGLPPGSTIPAGTVVFQRILTLSLADDLPLTATVSGTLGRIDFDLLEENVRAIDTDVVIKATIFGSTVDAVTAIIRHDVTGRDVDSIDLTGFLDKITISPTVNSLLSQSTRDSINEVVGYLATVGTLSARPGGGFVYDETFNIPPGTMVSQDLLDFNLQVKVTDTFFGEFYTVSRSRQGSSPLKAPSGEGTVSFSSVMTSLNAGLSAGPFVHEFTVTGLAEEQIFFFPQVGDGSAGSIRFQTGLIFVNTGAASNLTIDFFDSTGAPLELSLGSAGMSSSFQFDLGAGASLSLQTPGTGALSVGYARVTTGDGVGGTAVFSRTDLDSGTLLFEAGVPSATTLTDFSLVVDSIGNRDTGLALVNPPGGAKATVQLRLYDQQFQLIAERMLELEPGEHLPRFVRELFPSVAQTAAEMEGSVTVHSDVPLAAVTLRQNDDPAMGFPPDVPTLTTFPVIPGRSDLMVPPAVKDSQPGSD